MLYVEGRADRVLARRLGVSRREIEDGKGKGGVLRYLVQGRNCQGLVDEDPGLPMLTLMNRFVEASADDLMRLELRLYRHGERANTLIVLCPKLEDWLIAAAREVGLTVDDYGLPASANRLHDVINDDLRKLDRLFDDLLSAQSPRILRLQALLTD